MARIEAGEGDKGREREWLARAVRAPRDRAWIADGYVSDRWLPVSPVTGAVDAFEWRAPVDAIGRGDDTPLIEEQVELPRDASAMAKGPAAEPPTVVDVTPVVLKETPGAPAEEQPTQPAKPKADAETKAEKTATHAPVAKVTSGDSFQSEPKKPASVFTPMRPPDDPGVSPSDSDESPMSLERLRSAQIR